MIDNRSLVGTTLLASPHFSTNKLFKESVIYIFMHSKNNICGVVVNQQIGTIDNVSLDTLLKNTKNDKTHCKLLFQSSKSQNSKKIPILLGGLSNSEYFTVLSLSRKKSSENSNEFISLYLNMQEFIEDYYSANLISTFLIIKGITIWDEAQLVHEINNNFWFVTKPSINNIFHSELQNQWITSIEELGVKDRKFLTLRNGNA